MTRRATLLVGLGLAAIVALPVAVIIALGAYGQGLRSISGPGSISGPRLAIDPPVGRLGEAVEIKGDDWPPRVKVRFDISVPGFDRPISLGEVVSARNGGFSTSVVLPTLLASCAPDRIAVSASDGNDSVSAELTILPFDTAVRARVDSAADGHPVAGAIVEAIDRFGIVHARGTTGADGSAVLKGLAPGHEYRITAREEGGAPAPAARVEPEAGSSTEVKLAIPRAGGGTLYLSSALVGTGDAVRALGVDLTTRLAVEDEFPTAAWVPQRTALRADDVLYSNAFARGWLVSTDATGRGPGREDLPAVWSAMRTIQMLGGYDPQDVVRIRLLGVRRSTSELVVVANGRTGADIFIIKQNGGDETTQLRMAGILLGPFADEDVSTAWAIDLTRLHLLKVDLATGAIERRHMPALDSAQALIPAGDDTVYVFSDSTNTVVKVGPNGDEAIAELPADVSAITASSLTPDGRHLLLASAADSTIYDIDVWTKTVAQSTRSLGPVSVIAVEAGSGNAFLLGGPDQPVQVLRISDFRLIETIEAPPTGRSSAGCADH